MRKYTGENSYQLDYLPQHVKDLYEIGVLRDDEVEGYLEQVKSQRFSPSPADAAVGPLTEQEERIARSYEDSGGMGLGTGGAIAEAGASGISRPAQGVVDAAFEGQLQLPLPFDLTGRIGGLTTAYVLNKLFPGYTSEESREARSDERLGQSLAIGDARERAGEIGKTAIDLAPNITSTATTLGAMAATKNPTLAALLMTGGTLATGGQVFGESYLEGREVYDPEKARQRATAQAGVEMLTERLLNPVGGSTSLLKNWLAAAGGGGLQETVAEAASMGLDSALYDELAPRSSDEVFSRLGQAAKLGLVGSGLVAAPGAVLETAHERTYRAAVDDIFNRNFDPAVAAGIRDAQRIEREVGLQPIEVRSEPEQLDMFPTTEQFLSSPRALEQRRLQEQEEAVARQKERAVVENEEDRVREIAHTAAVAARDGSPMAAAFARPGLVEDLAKLPKQQTEKPTAPEVLTEDQQLGLNLSIPKQPVSAQEKARIRIAKREDAAAAVADKKTDATNLAMATKTIAKRKKVEEQVAKELPNLTPDEFEAVVNLRIKNGAAATTQDEVGTVSSRVAPVTTPATKKQAAAKTAKDDYDKAIEAIKSGKEEARARLVEEAAFSSEGASPPTRTPLTQEAISKKILNDDSKSARRLRAAIASGNLKIVKDVDALGIDNMPRGVRGVYFKGRRDITLVAENLTEETLMPVLQHEVKHYFDAKDGSHPLSFKNVVGDEANVVLIDKITKAAEEGNSVAKAAVSRLKKADKILPGQNKDELVTYFIEEAAIARNRGGILGKAASIMNDAVSASNSFLRQATGLPASTSLRDLEYLSRKMLDEFGKTSKTAPTSTSTADVTPEDGIKFSFAGRNSATKNTSHLYEAMRRTASGENKEQVRRDTGWFRGVDKKWRYEISDHRAAITPGASSGKLPDVLSHDKVFAAYPELREVTYRSVPKFNSKGQYDPTKQQITVRDEMSDSEKLSTIMHELQHWIQSTERFAVGSNLKDAASRLPPELRDDETALIEEYKRSAGEVEARNVQARLRLTDGERRDTPPQETQDVPSAKQHVNIPDHAYSLSTEADITYPADSGFGTSQPAVTPIGVNGRGYVVTKDSSAGTLLDAFNKVFTGGRVPSAFREMHDRATGEQAEAQLIALTHLNSLNKVMEATGDYKGAYNRLLALENASTRAERVKMLASLKADMPQVWQQYQGARRAVFNYTNDIIDMMTRDGYRLTEKEKAVVAKMHANLGNYLTTTYAIFSSPKVRQEHVKWLNNSASGRAVRERAMQWAKDNLYDFSKLQDMSKDYLEAAYEAFIGDRDVSSLSREELISGLEAKRAEVSAQQIDKQARRFVEDLVRVRTATKSVSRAANLFRGSRQDLTIITPKTNVPEEIRALWGEQNNPVMNVFATLVKQGEFIARMKSQFRMLAEMKGTYIFDSQNEVPEGAEAVELSGESFGPLQGKWTTREVADFLDVKQNIERSMGELIQAMWRGDEPATAAGEAAIKAFRGLSTAGGWFKRMSVVFNPINWAYNFIGSPLQLIMNGNYKNLGKGLRGAMRVAPGAAFQTDADDMLKELVRNRVLDNSLIGEIQDQERQSIVRTILQTGNDPSKIKKAFTAVTDYYAAMDVWAKVANYYSEKEFVQEYYKALGKDVTSEQIERIAAERIRKTNFTFDRAFGPAKFLEKTGITNFLTYNSETFRTSINNFILAAQDIRQANNLAKSNPKAAAIIRAHGTKRLLGATVATAGHAYLLSQIGAVLAMAVGEDEDELDQAIKEAGLDSRDSNRMLVLMNKVGDVREYFDVGRLDPYGPFNDMARALISGDTDKVVDTAKGLVIFNEAMKQIGAIAVAAATPGEQKAQAPRVKYNAEDVYNRAKEILMERGLSESESNRLMRLTEDVLPKAVVTGMTAVFSSDDEKSSERRLFEGLGGSIVKLDLREEINKTAAFTFNKGVQEARQSMSDYIQGSTNPSQERMEELFSSAARMEFEGWSEVLRRVEAAQLAGIPLREIQAQLKAARLNTDQINSITRKKFYPTSFSRDKLEGDMNTEIEAAETDGRLKDIPKIREKYRKVTPFLTRLNRNYKAFEQE